MDNRERGSHAQGVYPTHTRTARVKQEEKNRHKNNSRRVVKNIEERNAGTKVEDLKQDLTIMFPEGNLHFIPRYLKLQIIVIYII